MGHAARTPFIIIIILLTYPWRNLTLVPIFHHYQDVVGENKMKEKFPPSRTSFPHLGPVT